MQQLSLFRGVHDTQPRPVTLEELVTMMRTDQSVRDLTEKHRYARATGDEQRASRHKKMMASFGVAARFEGGRQQKHIVELTGLSLVDIDHIPPEKMAEVLDSVRADEHTLLTYTTLSGQGVRILARYETHPNPPSMGRTQTSLQNNSCEHSEGAPHRGGAAQRAEGVCWDGSLYKQAFLTINEYYQNLTGLPTDHQCKNIGRISTIAYDEQLYYNPEATPFIVKVEEKRPVGRPRKVQSGKMKDESGKMTVERCERLVQRELERRGIVYEAGTYNKYVSAFCYEMNRYGVPEEECREWAVNRFDDYNTPEVEAIVRSCYQRTEEHGTIRPPREAKDSYASVREIQDWLTRQDIRIRHNVITRRLELKVNGDGGSKAAGYRLGVNGHACMHDDDSKHNTLRPKQTNAEFVDLTDRHVNSLYRAFSLDTGRRLRIADLYIIIESDFYPTYHPLREYLQQLPTWDGTDHIDALASRVHVIGCSQEMHNRYFKKWLVAMVATWMVDDVTNHEILTYIGPQGIYKSTFMRQLLPPALSSYFSARNFAHRMGKDDRLELTEMGLIALEELDHMKGYELNQLKAITTSPAVNERAAYAHYRERRAHLASFCGTGNNPRFLTDLTGNRRWLPFMVDSIDSPYEHPLSYEGIYAQAYALWQSHFPYWLDEAENAELEQHNRHFEEPNIEEELILTYLRHPHGDEVGEFVTATRIIELVGAYIKTKLSPRHVTMTMRRLGFEQRRTSKARGWNVVILTGDDIKNNQRQDAHQSQVIDC